MPTTWAAQKIHFLTQPELRALFRVITRRRDRALFLVAYRHGLRTSEVGLLQVDGVNFAQQRLTVRRVKRSLPGIYPLQPSSRHPLLWWGMNSTLFGKYRLDQDPEPHGTSSRARIYPTINR